ncbi:uncharacterized protein LOC121989349 isoform X2 [Zingiber officinale]|uniref:uncharacterized protein LOC121989349 isoform X2 n=1 Tax=Zingiber officinale TaxID=94328 RepID=UPI001C4AD5C2|nr:uncharacterized protein LOC121989349 isoform X2 [Zingiber officinale]
MPISPHPPFSVIQAVAIEIVLPFLLPFFSPLPLLFLLPIEAAPNQSYCHRSFLLPTEAAAIEVASPASSSSSSSCLSSSPLSSSLYRSFLLLTKVAAIKRNYNLDLCNGSKAPRITTFRGTTA